MKETFEPERYELAEPPAYVFTPTRREFLDVVGAGLLISITASGQRGPGGESLLSARLHLAESGVLTVFTGKVEVGQGARTQIAMAAAEESGIPLDRIKVVMGDSDLVPNDGITAGSRTTPSTIPAVRKAAAVARKLTASKEALAGVRVPGEVEVRAVKEWRVLGQSQGRADGREIVTGAHQFPSDIRRPGMLYGSVLRSPAYGATLREADLAPAKAMPGVTAVRDGAFVGCAAPSSFEARKAMQLVAAAAEWERKEHVPAARLFEHLKATARKPRVNTKGSLETGFAAGAKRVKAAYRVPYIQHAPMEPRAAVAEWTGGKLTVWTGTQNPFGVRDQLAQAFHLDAAAIRVIVPDSGGGFGGKHTGEVAIEAARLAKEAGKPVSLRWTRAEEFRWAYFRPAGLFEIEAAIGKDGIVTAWDFANYNAGTAAMESPYRTGHTRTQFFACESPLREGSYRGIAATANTFARECFMDELAGAANMDPLEFRLANIENPRLRDVLVAAAKNFRWTERRKSAKPGTGLGIACGTEKGSYVAACVEVDAAGIREFHMAYECGAIQNPGNLRAQVEGSIIQGLGGALTEAMDFANGQLTNGSFAKYRVPRFKDVPRMEIVLLDRKDLASAGAGETPIIAVAPAIANAVSAMRGVRVRALPVAWS